MEHIFYLILAVLFLGFALIIGPFCVFPTQMEGYGQYLTGLAAILAALKFMAPYLIILYYKKRYSNEIIWRSFLEVTDPDVENGRVLETDWIAGVIGYFRRCEETLLMGNPWYDKLPCLADEVSTKFGTTTMLGKNESLLFAKIKDLLFQAADVVAFNATPDRPMVEPETYEELTKIFRDLLATSDEMNKLVVAVPPHIKKMIDGNDLFRSFVSKMR